MEVIRTPIMSSAETDTEGASETRFIPVPAFQTAEAMEELCTRFLEAWEADRIDKLVPDSHVHSWTFCVSILSMTEMSRNEPITHFTAFYKAGYIVGKYVNYGNAD